MMTMMSRNEMTLKDAIAVTKGFMKELGSKLKKDQNDVIGEHDSKLLAETRGKILKACDDFLEEEHTLSEGAALHFKLAKSVVENSSDLEIMLAAVVKGSVCNKSTILSNMLNGRLSLYEMSDVVRMSMKHHQPISEVNVLTLEEVDDYIKGKKKELVRLTTPVIENINLVKDIVQLEIESVLTQLKLLRTDVTRGVSFDAMSKIMKMERDLHIIGSDIYLLMSFLENVPETRILGEFATKQRDIMDEELKNLSEFNKKLLHTVVTMRGVE